MDTCPFLGPLVPLFGISGDVSSRVQSQSGFCLIRYFCGGKCNVHSPRFTSGATLADLLATSVQPVTSPHACAEVGLGSDSNVQSHEQKTNALPLCQRPGYLDLLTFILVDVSRVSVTNCEALNSCKLLSSNARNTGLALNECVLASTSFNKPKFRMAGHSLSFSLKNINKKMLCSLNIKIKFIFDIVAVAV